MTLTHGAQGRFFIQLLHPPDLPEEDRLDLEKFIGHDYLYLGGSPSSHAETRVLSPKFDKSASANVASWFEGLFSEPSGPEKLVHPSGAAGVSTHMDDPRVREWTVEEVNSIREWMNRGQAIVQLKDVVKVCPLTGFRSVICSLRTRILLPSKTGCKVALSR